MHITVEEASKLLLNGQVVAVPTETVYGLAAPLLNPQAIAEIYALKGRPSNNPLIIHVASVEQILPFLKKTPEALKSLAKTFWPGPLTLILPIIETSIPAIGRASLPTGAFRVPHHPLALELIQKTGPLLMPSANLSGSPSATSASHVEHDFGTHFPVLDGGPCQQGVESTILYWNEASNLWEIARLGALPPEAFKKVLGYVPKQATKAKEAPICPGQLYRHYAPKAKLTLTKMITLPGVVIGFEDRNYPEGCHLISLGISNAPETATHRLYAALRQLDQEAIKAAYVDIDFPSTGLWLTVRERLEKASGLL